MDLRRVAEVPHRHGSLVCREDWRTQAAAFLAFLVLTCGVLSIAFFPEVLPVAQRPPRWLALLVAAGLSLFVLVSAFTLRASLRPANWLVRLDDRWMFIKFHSYLNHHLPEDDPVVLALERGEIGWIRKTSEKRVSPGLDRTRRSSRWRYLDLGVSTATTELEDGLSQERRREAPMVGRSRTKAEHYPVRVPEPGVIRVEWTGPRTHIRPSLDRTIAVLRRHFPVLPELRLDDRPVRDLDAAEVEARIRERVESGEILAAVELARLSYGMSTTQAREHVDGLLGP